MRPRQSIKDIAVENITFSLHISKKIFDIDLYLNSFEKELILSGSEDEKVYVWNKEIDYAPQSNQS